MTMKQLLAVGAGAALVLTVAAGSADAQGRGRGNDKDKSKAKAKQSAPAHPQVVVVFRDNDRVTFRDYFVKHKIVAQPLPPGIAMNIARGKPLPPGIAKKTLPADLIVLVPRADPNVTYYIVGDRIVAVRNGNVVDILLNVFR